MIMPIDIDKKEFTRDKKGYNSREVDEFLDIIVADYEKILNDNRSMAHKIKALEKQLEEAQKDDNAMLETLETAKKLMADISASAERRAELMMRDAELEAENMLLDAKVTVRQLNEEHNVLSNKIVRLRNNFRKMLEAELAALEDDPFSLIGDLDAAALDKDLREPAEKKESFKSPTIIVDRPAGDAPEVSADALVDPSVDLSRATVTDLAKSAGEGATTDTIILK